ncbi:MAG TPA: ATP-binding protein [Chloroflexota bacterium]|nr:ATP-binding protein [Chloroflexota bacterium]
MIEPDAERQGTADAAESSSLRAADLRGILKRILRQAIAALDGGAGMLVLWRSGGNSPEQEVTIGLHGQAAAEISRRLTAARQELERAARSEHAISRLFTTQITADIGLLRHHLALLPLSADGQTFGIIGVLRSASAFSAAEERVLAAFADQAGISVRNAGLVSLLRREKENLSRVIEQSTDGIIVCDRERHILSVNAALEQMSGRRRRELIGRRLDEALTLRPAGGGAGARLFAEIDAAADANREVDLILQAQDGTLLHVALIAVVPDDERAPDGQIILYVRNMTRLHELEELRSTFLSMTSHELQTPVAIIKAYAETLQRKFGDSDSLLREGLDAIDGETDRLSRLINNLLRVSRLEAGSLPVRLVEVDLPELAHLVVKRLEARTERHHFVVEFPRTFPAVQADPERIEEVLTNLVDNAIKYSPKGGTIRVEGRVTASAVEVTVSDQGPGIKLSEQGRLFQRFYRVQGDPNRQTTGVGLGLFLVQAIVEAHGGQIWVNSDWGKGASFTFSLPRGVGPALPAGQADTPAGRGA